jgi:hypothetical protein
MKSITIAKVVILHVFLCTAFASVGCGRIGPGVARVAIEAAEAAMAAREAAAVARAASMAASEASTVRSAVAVTEATHAAAPVERLPAGAAARAVSAVIQSAGATERRDDRRDGDR